MTRSAWWHQPRKFVRPTVRKPLPWGLRTSLEFLEERDVPATSVIAIGADAGGGPRVSLVDRSTGATVQDFFAYDPAFTGGVRVAVGDFNGDGHPDVVTAPGKGLASQVKVFDGKSAALIRTFDAFDPGFTGGVNLAVGDITGDGTPDIVVAAEAGGGPRVQVLDGKSAAMVQDFFAFDAAFAGGVRVAVGDVTGDKRADLIAAAGPGGGPAVRVFDGVAANPISAFFAFEPGFAGGVNVAAADLSGDGIAEIITGAGAGGGPVVRTFDSLGKNLSSFFAYDPSFTGGVRVATLVQDAFGLASIVTAAGSGSATDVRIFNTLAGIPSQVYSAFNPGFLGGLFVAGSNFAATVGEALNNSTDTLFPPTAATGPVLVTLQLKPLNIQLLGLEITSSPITVTVSVDSGDGKLLGNLLTVVSNLINLDGVNKALNNVLGNVVDLLNGATLGITNAVTGTGPLSTPTTAGVTPILNLFVAPVHLDLLGVRVDTSPITLTIKARSGEGLVLGNVLTELANLFNPPLPASLDLNFINDRLAVLLGRLESQLPGIARSPVSPVVITDKSQFLRLIVPPIDLNLLGLGLKTSEIKVNGDALVGDGKLLGNVLTTLLNTLNATPESLTALNNNLNGLLSKVVGVLNAADLSLAVNAVAGLSQVLQTLALPDLVNATGAPATAPVLNLSIASPDGTTPPVDVDLLGLKITTSNIQAQLTATTGEGQVLGNLVYNVAHLLDPGGSLNLLTILNRLGL